MLTTETVKISVRLGIYLHNSNKTAPHEEVSHKKIELKSELRQFRKVFMSALIVPYPDDLYLSPRLRGNSIINLEITISESSRGL